MYLKKRVLLRKGIDMKHFKGKALPFAFFAFALLLCGCRSDIYYQNLAVEKARKYMLEKADDLDWKQREFVRYSDPVLLHSHVLGSGGLGSSERLGGEQRQICVTWQIPGKKGVYMVFGVSNGRMSNWYPERLIRKDYGTLPDPLAAVAAAARGYARNNLFDQLSTEQMNHIRFTSPALLLTDFKLEIKMPDDPEERKAFEAALAKKLQLTLVWDIGTGKSLFFCGRGMPDLSSWQIERAGIIENSELAGRTKRTVLTPAQQHDALPELTTPATAETLKK